MLNNLFRIYYTLAALLKIRIQNKHISNILTHNMIENLISL